VSALLVRPLDRERDLTALLDLVGRSRARGEASAIFHPGGLQWRPRRIGRSGFEVAVLLDDSELVGMALQDQSDLVVQTDGAHTTDRVELLAWAETRIRENGDSEAFAWVPADDDLRRSAVSRGYEPTERIRDAA